MLTKCLECELPISNKALICPHCGFPLKESNQTKPRRKKNKRRRLPNGFGQISEIKNRNLRKPFRAMITISKDKNGRPICKILKPEGYFETYNEAYTALLEYNKNPYNISASITVNELFEKWIVEYEKTVKSTMAVKVAWRYCSAVYEMPTRELRARHIKACIDNGTAVINGYEKQASAVTKNHIKTAFNLMLDYAVEYEVVDRNYARTFKLDDEVMREIKSVKKEHIPFSNKEMNLLWDHVDDLPNVIPIIVQCYSGWRPQELCLIELKDVNMDKWEFTSGMKTQAGINRTVPIHPRIRPLVQKAYDEAVTLKSPYLFVYTEPTAKRKNITLTYDRYRECFGKVIDALKLNPLHRPHDCRKHFVSMAKKYKVDEYAIKYIVGHAVSDITEKVYTERDPDWLHEEIKKIK